MAAICELLEREREEVEREIGAAGARSITSQALVRYTLLTVIEDLVNKAIQFEIPQRREVAD